MDKKSFPTSDARVFVFVSVHGHSRGVVGDGGGGGGDNKNKNKGMAKDMTSNDLTTLHAVDTMTKTTLPPDPPPAVERDEIARVLGVVPVDLALDRLQSVVKKIVGASGTRGNLTITTMKSPKLHCQQKDRGSLGEKEIKTDEGNRISDDVADASGSSGNVKKKSRWG